MVKVSDEGQPRFHRELAPYHRDSLISFRAVMTRDSSVSASWHFWQTSGRKPLSSWSGKEGAWEGQVRGSQAKAFVGRVTEASYPTRGLQRSMRDDAQRFCRGKAPTDNKLTKLHPPQSVRWRYWTFCLPVVLPHVSSRTAARTPALLLCASPSTCPSGHRIYRTVSCPRS